MSNKKVVFAFSLLFNEKQQLPSHIPVAKRVHLKEGLGTALFMKLVFPEARVLLPCIGITEGAFSCD